MDKEWHGFNGYKSAVVRLLAKVKSSILQLKHSINPDQLVSERSWKLHGRRKLIGKTWHRYKVRNYMEKEKVNRLKDLFMIVFLYVFSLHSMLQWILINLLIKYIHYSGRYALQRELESDNKRWKGTHLKSNAKRTQKSGLHVWSRALPRYGRGSPILIRRWQRRKNCWQSSNMKENIWSWKKKR